MEEIIKGNVIAPESVSIPTVQTFLRPDQPIVYTRGQPFSVYVKFPKGTKRLLFTISKRVFSPDNVVFQQIVVPNIDEEGVAEFFVDGGTTLGLDAGLYFWDIFQLRDDGTRDIWSPYNKGTFSIVDSPGSYAITLETHSTQDIYNPVAPSCNSGRNATLVLIKNDEDWNVSIRWIADSVMANLTGYTAFMPIKATPDSESNLLELSTENGRILLNSETSTISLIIPVSIYNSLALGTYSYYLQLIRGTYNTKLIGGNFIVQDPE